MRQFRNRARETASDFIEDPALRLRVSAGRLNAPGTNLPVVQLLRIGLPSRRPLSRRLNAIPNPVTFV